MTNNDELAIKPVGNLFISDKCEVVFSPSKRPIAGFQFAGSVYSAEQVEALLAEREADKKRITELADLVTDYGMKFQRAQDDLKKAKILFEDATMRANRADFEGYSRAVREYGALPAPVVPDERAAFEDFMEKRFKDSIDRRQVKNGDGEYFAWDMQVAWMVWRKRAAMQAEPVTVSDDVRRMDWLVSKTVNVREPQVYGSHNLFWSQTISDDWAEVHETSLRQQIDVAMAAEQPAAPEQEV